jgi:hypothetical protein
VNGKITLEKFNQAKGAGSEVKLKSMKKLKNIFNKNIVNIVNRNIKNELRLIYILIL